MMIGCHAWEGIDQRPGFFRGQLARIGFRMRLGPAVLAGKVTGAGHFPRNKAAQREPSSSVPQATAGIPPGCPGDRWDVQWACQAGLCPCRMAAHGNQRTHPFLRPLPHMSEMRSLAPA